MSKYIVKHESGKHKKDTTYEFDDLSDALSKAECIYMTDSSSWLPSDYEHTFYAEIGNNYGDKVTVRVGVPHEQA